MYTYDRNATFDFAAGFLIRKEDIGKPLFTVVGRVKRDDAHKKNTSTRLTDS